MSNSEFELVFHQAKIRAAPGDELGMGANFHDSSPVQHDDMIGIFYRTETVGDDDNRPLLKKRRQSVQNRRFIPGVQRVGGFVQK